MFGEDSVRRWHELLAKAAKEDDRLKLAEILREIEASARQEQARLKRELEPTVQKYRAHRARTVARQKRAWNREPVTDSSPEQPHRPYADREKDFLKQQIHWPDGIQAKEDPLNERNRWLELADLFLAEEGNRRCQPRDKVEKLPKPKNHKAAA